MQSHFVRALLAVCLLAGLARAQAGVRRFDFGWAELDPPEGFVKVTKASAYSKEKGWGFSGKQYWGGYAGRFPHNHKVAYKHLDPLSRDGVRIGGTFVVDVPNGEYLVWYLEGDPGTYALHPIWDHLAYGLTIEGREVHKSRPWNGDVYLKEYYRGYGEPYRRGEDVYERFVTPYQTDATVAVSVKDGQLTLQGGGLNLCAMMIHPASRKAEFEAEVARLRKARRDFFYSVVKVREPAHTGPVADVSAKDKARGYRLWPRHKMRKVSPSTLPAPNEPSDTLKAIASPAQSETVTFCVRPLAKLNNARVAWSDLVGPGGAKIAATDIRARLLYFRVQHQGRVIGAHLAPAKSDTLLADHTRQYWITIAVPEGQTPGVYVGEVTFSVEGRPSNRFGLKVKVLPIKLRGPYDDATYVMQSTSPPRYTYQMGFDKFPGAYTKGLKDMYRHLKTLQMLPQFKDLPVKVADLKTPEPKVTFSQDWLDRFIMETDEYVATFPAKRLVVATHRMIYGYWIGRERRTGTSWPSQDQPDFTWRAIKKYFEAFEALRAQHPKWPEFYYVTGAEMSNGGRDHVLYGKKFIETVESIPVRTIACPNGAFEARTYAPLVDVIAPNYAVPLTDPAFKGIPNEKTELWIYQAFNRFSYGFYAAKVKATGSFKEFYLGASQRPYNSFDGEDVWVCIALPSPDGMLSIPLAEEFSWGIDDFRYIKTLEHLIADARKSGNPDAVKAADEGDKLLAGIYDNINPDLDYYLNQAGWWDYTVYDTYRWMVAGKILALQKALNR